MTGRVVHQVSIGSRFPSTALIEQDDAVVLGVKEASAVGKDAASGTAVNKDDGIATRVTDFFKVDVVPCIDLQEVHVVRLDDGVHKQTSRVEMLERLKQGYQVRHGILI